jgi:hypothetical protein
MPKKAAQPRPNMRRFESHQRYYASGGAKIDVAGHPYVHTNQPLGRRCVIAFARALGMSPGKVFQEDWVGQAKELVGEKG